MPSAAACASLPASSSRERPGASATAAAFDVAQWCESKGFLDVARHLASLGVTQQVDLRFVEEGELSDMGLTPFLIRKWLRRVHEKPRSDAAPDSVDSAKRLLQALERLRHCDKVTEAEYTMARSSIFEEYLPLLARHVFAGKEVDPEKALTVYPATDDIDVAICRAGDAPDAPPVAVASGLAPIDMSKLGDGEYKVLMSIRTSKIDGGDISKTLVKTVNVTVNGGRPSRPFLDSGATITKFGVFVRDAPVQKAMINLLHIDSKITYAVQTDASGYTTQALPPGEFEKMISYADVIEKETFKVLPKPEKTEPPTEPEPPMSSNRFRDCQQIIRDKFYAGQIIAVMGDVSDSMNAPGQMDILRKTLRSVYDQATKAKAQVHLYTWNTDVVATYSGQGPAGLDQWLEGLQADDGNDMYDSLIHVLRLQPRVNDVYVMCDGDVTPFRAGSSTDWGAFARQYAHIRFHFVALGERSKHQEMREMALAGKSGTFTLAT